MGILDRAVAFDLDRAAAAVLIIERAQAVEDAKDDQEGAGDEAPAARRPCGWWERADVVGQEEVADGVFLPVVRRGKVDYMVW